MSDLATKTSNKEDQALLVSLIVESKLSDEAKAEFNEECEDLQKRIDDTKGQDVSQETLDGICEDIATLKVEVDSLIDELSKVSDLKESYTVKVIKISYGGNRIIKGGAIVKTVRYGEDTIKEWLSKGLIG